MGAQEAYAAVLERDTLEGYSEFLAAYPNDPMGARVRALAAARREAITWQRSRNLNTSSAYWTYLQRYPRGAHAADARRLLTQLGAPAQPTTAFIAADLGIPPPPAEEATYVERPVLAFDDPTFGFPPPPPPPIYFLPPPPPYWVVLPPPPPPFGVFLLPVPVFTPFPLWVRPITVWAAIAWCERAATPADPTRKREAQSALAPSACAGCFRIVRVNKHHLRDWHDASAARSHTTQPFLDERPGASTSCTFRADWPAPFASITADANRAALARSTGRAPRKVDVAFGAWRWRQGQAWLWAFVSLTGCRGFRCWPRPTLD
jgi:hypothetical protein